MPMPMPEPVTGPVEVVGAGLLGTSLALALARQGVEVLLSDLAEEHVRTASGLGAGRAREDADRPALVVVAVPPDHVAGAVAAALRRDPQAVVTDVGSVKAAPLRALVESGVDVTRYVGSHPMAGSERSGPLAANAGLFDGRPWAVTAHPAADPAAVAAVTRLASAAGAVPVALSPEEHDQAVAATSHVPHLLASLAAARLAEAPASHLALSGQGVRDVTRVAGGDPGLYAQIVSGNAEAVLALLGRVREDLDAAIAAVGGADRERLVGLLDRGLAGTRAIPGKHGGPPLATQAVFVAVPDHPGELARLFADAGEIGVNIEDVHIDHDPGRAVGQVELVVAEASAEHLSVALESRGWLTHR